MTDTVELTKEEFKAFVQKEDFKEHYRRTFGHEIDDNYSDIIDMTVWQGTKYFYNKQT